MKTSVGQVLWFTGLSGAGKSTLSTRLFERLTEQGFRVRLWDGDSIRKAFTHQLGFSREDILKNNEFILDLCVKDLPHYDFILVAAISPFRESRERAKEVLKGQYHEIFVEASIDEVSRRDVKGLYKKALAGEIQNFIGISKETPYEAPANPALKLNSEYQNTDELFRQLETYVGGLVD